MAVNATISGLSEIAPILRKTTLIVKIAPFVYNFMLCMSVLAYMSVSDFTSTLLDTLFYISPLSSLTLILLSYSLKLCVWHRMECVLPLFATVFSLSDYAFEYGEGVVMANYVIVAVIFVGSIINGIKMVLWKQRQPIK